MAVEGEVVVRRRAGRGGRRRSPSGDADDGDRLGVDPEGAADNGGIAVIGVLPGVIAHDGGHGSALDVVGIGEQAPRGGLKAEGAEVVAGDEFSLDGMRLGLNVYPAAR